MNKDDMHLGGMYLVLAAAVGTYGAVADVVAARYVGGVIGVLAAWYLCRAAVRLYRLLRDTGYVPVDYSSVHYLGITAATLGVLALTQVHVGVMYTSLAGVVLGLGVVYGSAGLYERYKRRTTTA